MSRYDPDMSLGATIRRLREAAGFKTQQDLVMAVRKAGGKLSQPSLSSLENDGVAKPGALYEIAKVLKTTVEAIKEGAAAPADRGVDVTVQEDVPKPVSQDVTPLDHNHPLLQKTKMREDVPLKGTTLGAGDTFQMDGSVVDYVRRPPRLDGRKDVFCIYVEGSAMEPRYYPGELLYLEKIRPPRPGDFVVVELRPARPDSTKQAYLRMLTSIGDSKVKLRQFTPDKVLEIAREKILNIYRVMPMTELLGA